MIFIFEFTGGKSGKQKSCFDFPKHILLRLMVETCQYCLEKNLKQSEFEFDEFIYPSLSTWIVALLKKS